MRATRNPAHEISAGNPWYVDDQSAVQLGSAAFRAVVENRWRLFERAIDEWLARTGQSAPRLVLDAGCGDGINLVFLRRLIASRFWPTMLVGADYSPLRVARAGQSAGAQLLRASVTALPLASERFDVVICNQVLEHIVDDRTAFAELRRILRPGGLLIVGVPNEGSPLGLLRNHLLQRSILSATDHVNMYTRRALAARARAAGFEPIRIEPEGFFTPHTTLHALLNRWSPVRSLLNAAGRAMPGCAAGLQMVALRPNS